MRPTATAAETVSIRVLGKTYAIAQLRAKDQRLSGLHEMVPGSDAKLAHYAMGKIHMIKATAATRHAQYAAPKIAKECQDDAVRPAFLQSARIVVDKPLAKQVRLLVAAGAAALLKGRTPSEKSRGYSE